MTISFIDPGSYFLTFYIVVASAALLCLGSSLASDIGRRGNFIFLSIFGPLFFSFLILALGLRPIDLVFFDMMNYNRIFYDIKIGYSDNFAFDPIFGFLIYITSYFDAEFFFFVCANIYIWPLYFAYRTWFGRYWPYAFLVVAGSLSFFSFGVNTIRNGMAASLFIYALSRTRRVEVGVFMALAMGMHLSIILPIIAYLVTKYFYSIKFYLIFWLSCIPISLFFGGNIKQLVGSLGFDDRLTYFTDDQNAELFSAIGFRWDFVAYSSIAVLAGVYFTMVKKYRDRTYTNIFCIYLACNGFWILMIEANFTSRVAYLSWMLIDIVIIFPLLRVYIVKYQSVVLPIIALFNTLLAIAVVSK